MNIYVVALLAIVMGLIVTALMVRSRREEDPAAVLADREPEGESIFVGRQLEAIGKEIGFSGLDELDPALEADEVTARFKSGDYSDLDDKGRELLMREPDPDTDETRLEGSMLARTANAWTEPVGVSNKNPPCPGGHPHPEAVAIAVAARAEIEAITRQRDAFESLIVEARGALPMAHRKTDLASAIRGHIEQATRELAEQQRAINSLRNDVDQAHLELDRARVTRKTSGQKGVYRMLILYERIQRLRRRKAR